jgi:hypothetical protein
VTRALFRGRLRVWYLAEEQRKILRAVALAYRRVMRAPASTRADAARLAQNVRLKR